VPTPTVRRLQLGNELRHAREAAGRTMDEAGVVIERTTSTISRLEHGQTGIRQRDLADLLRSYGADPALIEQLGELARNNSQRGRWSGYRRAYPGWFRMFVDLEEDATSLLHFQVEVVPGLLQTEDYIRTVLSNGVPKIANDQVENAVRARRHRQAVLTKQDAPQVGFVVSESALRRVVGDARIMRDQLEHLAEVALLPSVQLQVLPFDAPSFGASMFGFILVRIPAPGAAGPLDFVYLEDYFDARYHDDKGDVEAYTALWNRLQAAALGPVESRTFVLEVAGSIG
jgi:transcriptional regulator with XRE-family HTH domain